MHPAAGLKEYAEVEIEEPAREERAVSIRRRVSPRRLDTAAARVGLRIWSMVLPFRNVPWLLSCKIEVKSDGTLSGEYECGCSPNEHWFPCPQTGLDISLQQCVCAAVEPERFQPVVLDWNKKSARGWRIRHRHTERPAASPRRHDPESGAANVRHLT
jgi:hypothetical protein